MTQEERKAVVALARQYSVLSADLAAMRIILNQAESAGTPPSGWQNELEILRQSNGYHRILAEFEAQIARMEKPEAETGLMEALLKTIEGKLPN